MGLVRAPYFIVAHTPTPVPQAQQTPNCAVRSPCLRLPLKNRPVSVLNVESPRAASRSPHQNAVASVQNFVTHHAAVTMLSALMPIVRLKNWLGSLHFSSLSWWPQSALLLPQPRLTWRGWCRVGGLLFANPKGGIFVHFDFNNSAVARDGVETWAVPKGCDRGAINCI